MSDGIGFTPRRRLEPSSTDLQQVVRQQALTRILAFINRSIDDIVNDPIAKNQVRGYFKLFKQIERSCELTDLEKQWNP